jgi:hypothetical protein
MKKLYGAAFAMAMMTSSVLAATATISDHSGKVLINKGKGFIPATATMSLNDGDKVMVGENSFAVVSFADCAVSISSPTVMSITKTAPCAAAGDVTVVQPVADPVAGPAPIVPIPLIILGVAGVAGGVILATGVLDNNNDPVSVN